ncbi:ADP-ribosylglycohydrolase family protein [Candidatus Mycobacterium wuenschmannii]|uniref:ADP-ribosylglycohydrolase family protein n=1 Tax=Candidatus Mycobacterium wuenschmannii TaxID=3027808 RepID=A0ABY8VXB2_9MYCO|nr:ADP-ribosylglycohydrolase family protein [Candidatus Mycobacterium wuenschmannii]WIM87449.1 ADP-ribosylglycohydrolase family protein [Candidatus Mycobacterium wuenschmannii]
MGSYNDRVEGVLLGAAAGDALGAPYEFHPPRGPELDVAMVGGGMWERGEWTDDTAMAIAIAEVAATGSDLREASAQNAIVARWWEWSRTAKDVGIQTSSVLRAAGRDGLITADRARAESELLHTHSGRTAGNGSLMRTAPVALRYLGDEDAMVAAARAISELTHYDPEAGDACVLWCCAIRHAVHTGELHVRIGLRHIDAERRELWSKRLDVAERSRPADFPNNGWVVEALQAAWCAIATTAIPADNPQSGTFRADHLRLALDAAVRCGNDTDTVAAIAAALLGAAHGASAVPLEWRVLLHGWPGITAHELVGLASAIERDGAPDRFDYRYPGSPIDTLAVHPYDDKVLLGGVGVLRGLPDEVDAVISLCRLADDDMRHTMPHAEVRLIDRSDPDENPHLDYVLLDTVRLLEQLRAEGRTVLVHCVAAYSRTPAVAALYGARLRGVSSDRAIVDVQEALPGADPNFAFRRAMRRLTAQPA